MRAVSPPNIAAVPLSDNPTRGKQFALSTNGRYRGFKLRQHVLPFTCQLGFSYITFSTMWKTPTNLTPVNGKSEWPFLRVTFRNLLSLVAFYDLPPVTLSYCWPPFSPDTLFFLPPCIPSTMQPNQLPPSRNLLPIWSPTLEVHAVPMYNSKHHQPNTGEGGTRAPSASLQPLAPVHRESGINLPFTHQPFVAASTVQQQPSLFPSVGGVGQFLQQPTGVSHQYQVCTRSAAAGHQQHFPSPLYGACHLMSSTQTVPLQHQALDVTAGAGVSPLQPAFTPSISIPHPSVSSTSESSRQSYLSAVGVNKPPPACVPTTSNQTQATGASEAHQAIDLLTSTLQTLQMGHIRDQGNIQPPVLSNPDPSKREFREFLNSLSEYLQIFQQEPQVQVYMVRHSTGLPQKFRLALSAAKSGQDCLDILQKIGPCLSGMWLEDKRHLLHLQATESDVDIEVLQSAEKLVQNLQTIKYNHPSMRLTREEACVLLTKISSHGFSSIYLQAMSNLKSFSGDFIQFLIEHFQEIAGNLRTKLEYKKLYSANEREVSCAFEATCIEPPLKKCKEPNLPSLPTTKNCKFCKTLNKNDCHPMEACDNIKNYLEGIFRIPENLCLVCFNVKSNDCLLGRARCTMLRSRPKYCVTHQQGTKKVNTFICKICARGRGIRVAFLTYEKGNLDISQSNSTENCFWPEENSLLQVSSEEESFADPWSVENIDHWQETVENSFENRASDEWWNWKSISKRLCVNLFLSLKPLIIESKVWYQNLVFNFRVSSASMLTNIAFQVYPFQDFTLCSKLNILCLCYVGSDPTVALLMIHPWALFKLAPYSYSFSLIVHWKSLFNSTQLILNAFLS